MSKEKNYIIQAVGAVKKAMDYKFELLFAELIMLRPERGTAIASIVKQIDNEYISTLKELNDDINREYP